MKTLGFLHTLGQATWSIVEMAQYEYRNWRICRQPMAQAWNDIVPVWREAEVLYTSHLTYVSEWSTYRPLDLLYGLIRHHPEADQQLLDGVHHAHSMVAAYSFFGLVKLDSPLAVQGVRALRQRTENVDVVFGCLGEVRTLSELPCYFYAGVTGREAPKHGSHENAFGEGPSRAIA